MARISILTPTLATADAVSNDVLGMYRVLKQRGHEVHLFAEDWNVPGVQVRYAAGARQFAETSSDILIYHHSIGWELGAEILESCACKTIIKYHNVTPPEFFAGVNPQLQQLCESGRSQLASIGGAHHTLYLAASAYNMQDLLAAGADPARVFVVPPFNQAENLGGVAPDFDVLDQHQDGKVNLLMVGSVRPNKGHALLIEAFARYYYDFNCHARLLIVGAQDEKLEGYAKTLRDLVELLHLEDAVSFTGEVPVEALKAYYLTSDAFVIASEHEGFCVPLVEAMSLRVPVIGYASGAITETIGDCGIIWDTIDPGLVAESIDALMKDGSLAAVLTHQARRRYEQMFANAVIERDFLRATRAAGFQF